MYWQRFLLSVTVLASCVVSATAQPNAYCRNLAPLMKSNTLYVAYCMRGENCLEPVVNSGGTDLVQGQNGLHRLSPGQRYRFLYKTSTDSTNVNSLVAINVKQLDISPRGTPSPVRLRRYPFHFACVGFRNDVSLPGWPGKEVQGRNLPSIPYDKYDQFHRFGFTSPEETALLKKFHVSYFNGQECVSTTDAIRRAQFLFTDRQDYHGPFVALAFRFGAYTASANAQSLETIAKYERLKVLVSNYSRPANTAGCFSFTTRAGAAKSIKLDVTVSDIEQQVRSAPFDSSRSWSFDLQ